jgi:hydrogenase expression/formation protein HypD
MKYIDEYRNNKLVAGLVGKIRGLDPSPCSLMEVCGTHTVAIARSGLREILPPEIRLLSGPGCPVCVTSQRDVDTMVALAGLPGVIVATFGDMVRVPGTASSLEAERAAGARVEVVYSSDDALDIAERNPNNEIVFIAVGFETTAPGIAATVLAARKRRLGNISFFVAHKLVPPALAALASLKALKLDGLICPGHVSAVIGSDAYRPVAEDKHIPCVVAGFEPVDIAGAIYRLVKQIREGRCEVENQYTRVVRKEGNPLALRQMYSAFEVCPAEWRGLGTIPASGLRLKGRLADYDALRKLRPEPPPSREPKGCRCGDVLAGKMSPPECALFGRACTPENPVGPCMVSSEGSCAAHYRYLAGR